MKMLIFSQNPGFQLQKKREKWKNSKIPKLQKFLFWAENLISGANFDPPKRLGGVIKLLSQCTFENSHYNP